MECVRVYSDEKGIFVKTLNSQSHHLGPFRRQDKQPQMYCLDVRDNPVLKHTRL